MRLFVALELPDAARQSLAGLIAQLRPVCPSAHWARPQSMHVTLKFIGHAVADSDAEKLAAVRAALAEVKSAAPIDMAYRGIGFFPNERRPHVFWCGIHASPNLAPLAADIEKALEPLGIPRELRAFVPHLTLARFKAPQGVDALVRAAREFAARDFGSSHETEFHLFESKLKPSGPEYRRFESYSFVRIAA